MACRLLGSPRGVDHPRHNAGCPGVVRFLTVPRGVRSLPARDEIGWGFGKRGGGWREKQGTTCVLRGEGRADAKRATRL